MTKLSLECMELDLGIALRKLHELQLLDGDLGADYWLQIAELLKEADAYRRRALTAEANLERMKALTGPPAAEHRPDPMRARYRAEIDDCVRQIVASGSRLDDVLHDLAVPDADRASIRDILQSELHRLEVHNCARFRLPFGLTQEWIDKGRQQ